MAMAWTSINNNPKQLNEADADNCGAAVAVRPALRLLHVPVASCVISECAILLFLNDIICEVSDVKNAFVTEIITEMLKLTLLS